MTVKSDLKKAVASAEAAKGTYAMFAESTDDPTAKAMFEQMQQDMQRHVDMLNGRLSYITDNNILYQTQQSAQNQQKTNSTGKGNTKIIQTK
jgi:rubrerythrin